jgi:NAD(P)-dependent dehydrogenase (short-subunit alcohol dehydrogenase family)
MANLYYSIIKIQKLFFKREVRNMELGLRGKNAIITGGSAGIGLACAKALVSEGANVIIIGRDRERLKNAVTILKQNGSKPLVYSIQEDLTAQGASQRIVEETISLVGKIDILINNAGAAKAGSFWELNDQHYLDAWNLKLLGYIRMVRSVANCMKERNYGRILNIIGTGGKTPSPTFLPGATANSALSSFTKGISKELAQFGIRINAISPGVTATERAELLAKQRADAKGITLEEQKRIEKSSSLLGEILQPEEIASMALMLVSDLIPSITGSEIVIDGGQQPGI